MTNGQVFVAALLAAFVTSCGSPEPQSGTETQGSSSSPAPFPKRLAGSWMVSSQTVRYLASGLPASMAGMAEAGKASVGKKDVGGPVCLTEARANDDTLDTRLQEAIRFGSEWSPEKREFKDGRVEFAAASHDPRDGEGRMTITGELKPDYTRLTVVTISKQPGGPGRIETEMLIENKRVGDCAPGQDVWQ